MASFETQRIPEGIVDFLVNSNKKYNTNRKPNHYRVTDICKCLRQSYHDISGSSTNNGNKENSIANLWSSQCGKFLHNLTYSYKWRELDMEREIVLPDIEEKVYLHGRLDMFDYRTETIIELKTTNAVKWQHSSGIVPKQSDIHQTQCYSFLFDGKIKVSNLTLLYADMKDMIPFRVPLEDKSKWIEERLLQLHTSPQITNSPPEAEPSSICDYCKVKCRSQS